MDHRRRALERIPTPGGVVIVTFERRRWSTRQRPRPLPPGPRGYPWLGVLPQMRHDSLGFLSAIVHTYGDIVVLPFGPVRVYLLCHPEQVAYVLQGHAPNYGKSRFSAQVSPLLGQGLATSDGALWRTQRRLVQPVFHRERLAGLAATITTATQAMLARWAPHAATGTPLDMLAEMTRRTGEVIVRALFGSALPEVVARRRFSPPPPAG